MAPESVREFLMDFWRILDPSRLISVYGDWIERHRKVIAIHEDYWPKQIAKIKFH
jgi:hypothetical protein